MEVRHGLMHLCRDFFFFFFIVGKTACYPFVQSTLSISFFNRQTQHSLSREGDSAPAKKKTKKKPIQMQAMQRTHTVFLFTGFKAFARPNISIVLGSRREHQTFFYPQPSLCPSRFLISKLATKILR